MDIFKITKSKTREKILQLFFSDVKKKYYLRELERLLGLSVANIRRELLSMEKAGLFEKEKMGNQTHYFLKKDSSLFNEYKSIVFKTIGIEGTLRKELKKIKGIKRAFIFGSFAKNKEDSSSDIDLMIIGEDIDEDILIEKINKLEKILRREINYHIWGQKEFEKKAKTESFIQSILEEPKVELI